MNEFCLSVRSVVYSFFFLFFGNVKTMPDRLVNIDGRSSLSRGQEITWKISGSLEQKLRKISPWKDDQKRNRSNVISVNEREKFKQLWCKTWINFWETIYRRLVRKVLVGVWMIFDHWLWKYISERKIGIIGRLKKEIINTESSMKNCIMVWHDLIQVSVFH